MIDNSLSNRIKMALREDQVANDVTTQLLTGFSQKTLQADLQAKSAGILCGTTLLAPVFRQLDARAQIVLKKQDGASIKPGEVVARIRAKAAAVLGGERVFLNLACHLSGIATLTHQYVQAVKGTSAILIDTRKTTPLWRDLEKMAVRCGGGQNHRFSLGDAVLIKDNHLEFLRQNKIAPAQVYGADVLKKKRERFSFVEMEARSIAEVWQAIKARVDIILLDNMNASQIKEAMVMIEAARKAFNSRHPLVEVSGGITIEKAREYARLGVDRISVGALTHSAPTLDLSLEVK